MNRSLRNANITEASAAVMVLRIFGGIERTDEKRFFAVTVMKRDAETLLPITQVLVHPESIIIYDAWGPCNNINKLDQGHENQTVNHTTFFVDPTTGSCSNIIESKRRKLKHKTLKRRHYFENVSEDILVQAWRHQNKGNLWNFLTSIKINCS